jgi:hypothetical protein
MAWPLFTISALSSTSPAWQDGKRPGEAVAAMIEALDGTAGQQRGKRRAGGAPAGHGHLAVPAGLLQFRRVDAFQPHLAPGKVQTVAVDGIGLALDAAGAVEPMDDEGDDGGDTEQHRHPLQAVKESKEQAPQHDMSRSGHAACGAVNDL